MPGPAPIFPPPAPAVPAEVTQQDVEPTRLFLDAAAAAARDAAQVAAPSGEAARGAHAREIVAVCEAELALTPEPVRAGRLHYELGRVYEVALDDIEKAREHYLAARERLPSHIPTLRGARRVLVALGRHPEALPLFDAEAKVVSDPHAKAMLLYEKGVLLEDRLTQKKEARRAYAAALELDASNPTILKAFERASALAGEWDDLDRAYEREANAVSSDARHRAAVISERARLSEAKKSNAERSIELYQTALGIDPRAPGALAALKSLLYAHARWRDLIAVLEEEAEQATDPETRALARYRVARLNDGRLGARDEAITALESAAAEAPGDAMVLGELARLYELGKRWGKLTTVLETIAAATPSAGERVALMHRIGQIAEERLDDFDRAIDWYRRALDADPAYVPALQALGTLYAQREHWTALIAMHLGEAGSTRDTVRRASAHARVAEILERRLGNLDQAIEHHARALGLVPGYPASFKALVRLYSQSARHRELAELYQRAVDLARTDELKITYLFKIGRLHEDALQAPLAALEAYQRILSIDAAHLGAIHAVQRAAERGEAWPELVAALDREAELVRDKPERAALIHRAAEIVEELLGDQEGALARYKKVLAFDERYAPALSSLGRLYYRGGRWEDLLGTYQLELAVTAPGPATAALLYKMGELSEERLGKDDEAIRNYRAAIDADPRHLTALRALARLESARNQWREVVRLLELELTGLEDKASRARTAFRIGEVYENRLDDRAKALEAYNRALVQAPDFRPAIDGRSRLLEAAREWRPLVEALEREAAASKDAGLAVLARLRAGEIHRDHLAQPEKAVEAFEAVLAVDPNHLGALLALEMLYAQLGATERLTQCLLGQVRILENGFARVAVLRELARLEETRVAAAPSDIAEKYLTIVRVAPRDVEALAALERTAIAHKDWALLTQVDTKLGALIEEPLLAAAHQTRLAEELEISGNTSALETYRAALARDPENIAAALGLSRLADRARDPALIAEAATQVSRVLRDPSRAANLLFNSARIRFEARRDAPGAIADLERALEVCPDHADSAVRLQDLLGASDPGKLADVLAHAAGRAKDPERRAALWVTVGGIHADGRGDIGAGLGALDRALKELPAHVPALMKEAELFARDSRPADAADRLGRVTKTASDPGVLLMAHFALATLFDRDLEQPERAVASLRAVLGFDEQHRGALTLLADIQIRKNELEPAAETTARLVAVCAEGVERAAALTRLARLERRRGRHAEAIEAYRQAVASTGVDGPALDEMRSILQEARRKGEPAAWDAYADGLGRYLERAKTDDPRLLGAYLELARVLADDLKQAERAIQTLRVGVARFGRDVGLRKELAARLRAAGHTPEAAEELRRLVDVEPLRVEIWRDLAESLRALGRADLAGVASEVLVGLGGGTDLERVAVQQRVARPAMLEAGAFNAETLHLLDAAAAEDAATTRVLSVVAPGLERAFPADFEAYGVSRGDRISPRAGHPTRLLADRIARIFGAPEFDLYVHQAHAGGVEVEFSDPVSIMVPAQVTALPQGQQAFLLARVLVDLARGLHATHKLSASSLGEVLVAAMRTVDPSFGGSAPEHLEVLTKNLYKGLPRRARRPLEEAAAAYVPSPKPRLDEWLLRVKKTANRAALLVSDDPSGAIGILRRTEGDGAGLEGAALERGMTLIADALRFSVSDVAASVRRRTGLG